MSKPIYVQLPDARVGTLVKTDSSLQAKYLVSVKGGGQENVSNVQTISEQEFNEASTAKPVAKKKAAK